MQDIPTLMPFQLNPFNGDEFIQEEFLRLKKKFNITSVIETGTCLAGTTIWLAQNFDRVFTVEVNRIWLKIAINRIESASVGDKVKAFLGKSEQVLDDIIKLYSLKDNTLMWLDAHWAEACPLLDELKSIANNKLKPIICIHDFMVPGEHELGYDTYGGQPFTFEWIKPYLDNIYGDGMYGVSYNTNENSGGAKRGIIYLTPMQIYHTIVDDGKGGMIDSWEAGLSS
jgi:hypothetical protein